MMVDPIEIRPGNYFEFKKLVKEISLEDLKILSVILVDLRPIFLRPKYLARLNFMSISNSETSLHYQKYTCGIFFNIFPSKSGSMTLYINDSIRLPHIKAIHQLQNIYYDLTGDVLKRTPPGKL